MEPIQFGKALTELSAMAGYFVSDVNARPHFIARVRLLFENPVGLRDALLTETEWEAARELGAAALYAADELGDVEAQRCFLNALFILAPITSVQYHWIQRRLQKRP